MVKRRRFKLGSRHPRHCDTCRGPHRERKHELNEFPRGVLEGNVGWREPSRHSARGLSMLRAKSRLHFTVGKNQDGRPYAKSRGHGRGTPALSIDSREMPMPHGHTQGLPAGVERKTRARYSPAAEEKKHGGLGRRTRARA